MTSNLILERPLAVLDLESTGVDPAADRIVEVAVLTLLPDGHKRRNGSKVPVAVDTLDHLLALKVTVANEQKRGQVTELATRIQASS